MYLILKRAIVDFSLFWSAVYGLLRRNVSTQQAEYFINYMTQPEADAHICILTVLIYPWKYMLQVKCDFRLILICPTPSLALIFIGCKFYV